jgi:hypothetical protein
MGEEQKKGTGTGLGRTVMGASYNSGSTVDINSTCEGSRGGATVMPWYSWEYPTFFVQQQVYI